MAQLEEGVVVFELKDVSLNQADSSSPITLTFTVKNNAPARANATLCVRLYDSENSAGDLDESSSEFFNLAPGASKTLTIEAEVVDEKHWDDIVHVKAYVAGYGCTTSVRNALSNVVAFAKPEHIQSPGGSKGDEPTLDEEHDEGDGEVYVDPVDDSMTSIGEETDGQ
jgi:hypothetical protein